MAKYNSAGTIQWIRSITNNVGSTVGQGLDIDANQVLTFAAYINGGERAMYLKVPNDGTKTGTYNTGNGSVTYSTTSDIYDSTSACTTTSSGVMTISSGQVSTDNGQLSEQSFSATSNTVVIS
jgi:hypothetical protein